MTTTTTSAVLQAVQKNRQERGGRVPIGTYTVRWRGFGADKAKPSATSLLGTPFYFIKLEIVNVDDVTHGFNRVEKFFSSENSSFRVAMLIEILLCLGANPEIGGADIPVWIMNNLEAVDSYDGAPPKMTVEVKDKTDKDGKPSKYQDWDINLDSIPAVLGEVNPAHLEESAEGVDDAVPPPKVPNTKRSTKKSSKKSSKKISVEAVPELEYPAQAKSADGYTRDQLLEAGWTDEAMLANPLYSCLVPDVLTSTASATPPPPPVPHAPVATTDTAVEGSAASHVQDFLGS